MPLSFDAGFKLELGPLKWGDTPHCRQCHAQPRKLSAPRFCQKPRAKNQAGLSSSKSMTKTHPPSVLNFPKQGVH